jgi:hypothetical protein
MVQRQVAYESLPIPHDTLAPRKNAPFMSFMPFMVKNDLDQPNRLPRRRRITMKDMKVMKGLKHSAINPRHALVPRYPAFRGAPILHDTGAARKNTPFMPFMPFMVRFKQALA